MSLSPILSRDIVATRLLFNAIKREKYINVLKDAVVGDYKWSAYNHDFHGWMKCDGTALNRTTYSDLYNIIGTTYGSNSALDFKLPDCRGRALFAAGQPTGGNITYNAHTLAQGELFGNQKHLLTISEMPSHTHTGSTTEQADLPESESVTNITGGAVVSGSSPRYLTFTTQPTGGDVPHNIENPSIVVGNVFIYSGVYEKYVPNVDVIGPNDNEYNA